jgi:hypothetical protein
MLLRPLRALFFLPITRGRKGMEDEFINLTPHRVRLFVRGRVVFDLPPAERAARVVRARRLVGRVQGFPVYEETGEVQVVNLPPARRGTWFIASRIVRDALEGRPDVVVPSGMIEGPDGRPVGCREVVR